MKAFIAWLFIGLVSFVFIPQKAQAQTFRCATFSGTSYCQYQGRVLQIYVNYNNNVLIYFEQPIDTSVPTTEGIAGVTKGSAAIIPIDEKPEFAKFFYSTALTAQATGREVVFQMRGSLNGYLKADRIWLHE